MRRGFTLLEVMISLAILAVGLLAVGGLNGGSVAMHAYGRRATEATLLLRGKMLDVEDELQKNGFSDFNDEKHGDFSDEGAPGYAWSAEILKPDVQLDPAQLVSLVTGGAQTPGQPGPAGPSPAPATTPVNALLAGPLAGMMQTQTTAFVETLKKSVREVRLTVSWPDGKQQRSVSASQIIVILPEMVGRTPGQPLPPPTGPRPGQPGAPGQPFTPGPGQSPSPRTAP